MKFLSRQNITKLQNILVKNTYLQRMDPDSRRDLLENCGLGECCNQINLDQSLTNFVPSLYNKLSKITIKVDKDEKTGLIVFLEHIISLDFSDFNEGEHKFIEEEIIQKWKDSSEHLQHKNNYKSISYEVSQQDDSIEIAEKPMKFDRSEIANYDMQKAIEKFKREVGYKGASAFAVGGDEILINFMIERIKQELKNQTGRKNKIEQIYLSENTLTPDELEKSVLENFDYFETDVSDPKLIIDFLLIIWNHKLPKKIVNPLAQSFWKKLSCGVLQNPISQKGCFVIIWVNVNCTPLTGFITLPIPVYSDLSNLLDFFENRLEQAKINKVWCEKYLKRLKNDYESQDVGIIYRAMNHIIQNL